VIKLGVKKGEKFTLATKNKSIKGKRYSLCMSVDSANVLKFFTHG